MHNSCNVKRGSFTAGSENKTVPKSSRMLARCCSTRCCFTLPYLFPCYFLTRDSKPSFVTTRFSLLLQNMSTSHPCKCPQFQQNFGKIFGLLGEPPQEKQHPGDSPMASVRSTNASGCTSTGATGATAAGGGPLLSGSESLSTPELPRLGWANPK